MISTLDHLTEEYASALEDYLEGVGEPALHFAYELGRKAIADGVGVLEMVSIHNKALANVFQSPLTSQQAVKMAGRASSFFAESLAPFEMALRGVREANSTLKVAQLELQRQNQELASAQQSSESERRRYRELFDFAPDGYLVTDLEGNIQEANKPAAALLQVEQEQLVGQSLPQFVITEERESLHAELGWLQRGRLEKLALWQIALQRPDGNPVSIELTVGAVRDTQGKLIGLRWLLRDATERRLIEEERAQLRIREHLARTETEAARRLKFLDVATTALAGSLDYNSIPDSIACLAVPYLADCCLIFLTDGSTRIRHFAAEHRDATKKEILKKLELNLTGAELPPPVADVLDTQKPEIMVEMTESWLQAIAGSGDVLRGLEEMHFRSALLAPLVARGRPLGVITFLIADSARHYTAEDLALGSELAHRFALILENARLYQEVVVAKENAEKASRSREEFVAILSHELRTPLMTIIGWARILKRQPQIIAHAVLGKGVRSLEHNAQSISRLVEDCLDIARISEGKIRLQRDLVDLSQVANAAFEATRKLAYDKKLRFVTQFSPTLCVWGDRTRLEEVILNLLTNAIKYTEPGGEVSIVLGREGEEAQIEVKDTGIGIETDFLEQIFEPFRQGTTSWLSSDSGLGIGLSIVREIVQMHGGHVCAESPGRGCGSTFRIRLPLETSPIQQQPTDSLRLPVAVSIKPLRILFIEDSVDALNLMKIELEGLGYSVLVAADGKSGLEVARRELPQIIVSDIKMPGLDGYELIKRIRQIPALATVPAIALTGFGMEQDIEKALRAGFNAHLCKPVELDHLAALIQKLSLAAEKSPLP